MENDLKEFNPHSWMRLVETSNTTEVSGASEVPQSCGKLIFLGRPAAVFLLENRSRLPKIVLIKINQY